MCHFEFHCHFINNLNNKMNELMWPLLNSSTSFLTDCNNGSHQGLFIRRHCCWQHCVVPWVPHLVWYDAFNCLFIFLKSKSHPWFAKSTVSLYFLVQRIIPGQHSPNLQKIRVRNRTRCVILTLTVQMKRTKPNVVSLLILFTLNSLHRSAKGLWLKVNVNRTQEHTREL